MTEEAKKKCPMCAEEIGAGETVCLYCESNLEESPPSEPASESPPELISQPPAEPSAATPSEPPLEPPPAPVATAGQGSKGPAALAYVFSLPGGLIMWFAKPNDAFVRFHAAQAALLGVAAVLLGVPVQMLSYLPAASGVSFFFSIVFTLTLVWLFLKCVSALIGVLRGRQKKIGVLGDVAERLAYGKVNPASASEYARILPIDSQTMNGLMIIAALPLFFWLATTARYATAPIVALIACAGFALAALSHWARRARTVPALVWSAVSLAVAVALLMGVSVAAQSGAAEADGLLKAGKQQEAIDALEMVSANFPLTPTAGRARTQVAQIIFDGAIARKKAKNYRGAADKLTQLQSNYAFYEPARVQKEKATCLALGAAVCLAKADALYKKSNVVDARVNYELVLKLRPEHPKKSYIQSRISACQTRAVAQKRLAGIRTLDDGPTRANACIGVMKAYRRYPEARMAYADIRSMGRRYAAKVADRLSDHRSGISTAESIGSSLYFYSKNQVKVLSKVARALRRYRPVRQLATAFTLLVQADQKNAAIERTDSLSTAADEAAAGESYFNRANALLR